MDYETARSLPQINADDPNALEKVRERMEAYVEEYERRKAVNVYYKKHGTLDGCPHTTPEEASSLIADIEVSCKGHPIPFGKKSMDNIGGSIRAFKRRIAEMEQILNNPPKGWKFKGGKVVFNIAAFRIQILFDAWPDIDTIISLKHYGFTLAPHDNDNGAWQRSINETAVKAAEKLFKRLED